MLCCRCVISCPGANLRQTWVNVFWRQKESFLQHLSTRALLWNVILFIRPDETHSAYWYNTVHPVGKIWPFFSSHQLSVNSGDWFPPGYNIKPSFWITGGLTLASQSRENEEITTTLTRQLHTAIHYTFTSHFSHHSTTYIYTTNIKTYIYSPFCSGIRAEFFFLF